MIIFIIIIFVLDIFFLLDIKYLRLDEVVISFVLIIVLKLYLRVNFNLIVILRMVFGIIILNII